MANTFRALDTPQPLDPILGASRGKRSREYPAVTETPEPSQAYSEMKEM